MVESAIVVPLLLFVFLCTLQIMLIAHTRILVDYAAFNAARAGVVHNGRQSVMRNAALLSLLPSFPSYEELEKNSTPIKSVLRRWAIMKGWADLGTTVDSGTASLEKFLSLATGGKLSVAGLFPSASVVSVDILNPGPRDFDTGSPTKDEIDFDQTGTLEKEADQDDRGALERTRLTIRVIYLYQLRVPLADRTIWYLYMAGAYVKGRILSGEYMNWWDLHGQGNVDIKTMIERTKFATGVQLTDFANGPAAIVREAAMFLALQQVADVTGNMFLMPLYSIHSMPLESNLFRENLDKP